MNNQQFSNPSQMENLCPSSPLLLKKDLIFHK